MCKPNLFIFILDYIYLWIFLRHSDWNQIANCNCLIPNFSYFILYLTGNFLKISTVIFWIHENLYLLVFSPLINVIISNPKKYPWCFFCFCFCFCFNKIIDKNKRQHRIVNQLIIPTAPRRSFYKEKQQTHTEWGLKKKRPCLWKSTWSRRTLYRSIHLSCASNYHSMTMTPSYIFSQLTLTQKYKMGVVLLLHVLDWTSSPAMCPL